MNYFYWNAGFLVFLEEVALGAEAAENLAVGQVVAEAGAAEAGAEGGCDEEDFFAALEELGGFVEDGGVYDGFLMLHDKVVYPFCDDWVNHGFLYL